MEAIRRLLHRSESKRTNVKSARANNTLSLPHNFIAVPRQKLETNPTSGIFELPGDFGVLEQDSKNVHEVAGSPTDNHTYYIPPTIETIAPAPTDIVIANAKATVTLPRGRFKNVTLSYDSTYTENCVSENFVIENEFPLHHVLPYQSRSGAEYVPADSYVELVLSLHPYNVKTSKVGFRVVPGVENAVLLVTEQVFGNQRLGLQWKYESEAMSSNDRMRAQVYTAGRMGSVRVPDDDKMPSRNQTVRSESSNGSSSTAPEESFCGTSEYVRRRRRLNYGISYDGNYDHNDDSKSAANRAKPDVIHGVYDIQSRSGQYFVAPRNRAIG